MMIATTIIFNFRENPSSSDVNTNNFVRNPSFESTDYWEGLTRRDDGYYSPVDGDYVAYLNTQNNWVSQTTEKPIEMGKTYELTVFARSVNEALNDADTQLELAITAAGETIISTQASLNPSSLQGAPENTPNDDGANVWIDGEYRVQLNETLMIQSIEDDPILDAWEKVDFPGFDNHDYMALGHIHVPDGSTFIYGTVYEDSADPFSEIWRAELMGNAPNYNLGPWELVLGHYGDQDPWVIDAHIFYEESTQRMWMSWGGHKLWVSELDPNTGKLLEYSEITDFEMHAEDTHYPIAEFTRDDDWSIGYLEGPALFKKDGYYYYFGTYGNLAEDYTIRVGRSEQITGPYSDKEYVDLMANGGSLLLGNEGTQLVPGHPHIWVENDQHYLGYDYRRIRGELAQEPMDYMGIRELFWVNGWPTVYTPITIRFNSDDYPDLMGELLSVQFKNSGDNNAELAVDYVTLTTID